MADTRNKTERHIEEMVELFSEQMQQVQGGACGIEDDINQVSYACEDWDMFWGADSAARRSSSSRLSK